MLCKICQTSTVQQFNAKLLNRYEIRYYQCPNCQFLQTEEPYWLDEAYSQSINSSDTGYMARNLFYAKKLTILLYSLFGDKGTYLDYAGGYGVFVRLMRDIGFNFYWQDKYTTNLFAQGFEWQEHRAIDAITAFEVFEHFVNPMAEIEGLLKISKTLIFSTEVYPADRPAPEDWWYFGLDHGQHIAFYSQSTFLFIAKKFNLNYYNQGSLHILTDKAITLFQLNTMKLSKLEADKVVRKLYLTSKTQSDYNLAVEKATANP